MMKQPIVPLAMPKTGTQHFKQRTKMSSYFVVKWDRLSSAFSHHLTYLNEMKF